MSNSNLAMSNPNLAYKLAMTDPDAQYKYAKAHCALPPYFSYAPPFPVGFTYHHVILLTAGVGTALCIVTSTVLAMMHLMNWVRPTEQKQIVRIIIFAPFFAIFNFFSVWFYRKSWILEPIPEIYETFALIAMFYLLVVYVAPDVDDRESFFQHLQRIGRYSKKPKHNRGSLRWFQVNWVMVFQILPVNFILSLISWILSAVQCPLDYTVSDAATAITVIDSVATSICVLAIITFERRMKDFTKGHKAVYKLWTFKGCVALVLTQGPVFSFLAEYQIFDRTKYMSVMDFVIGTPAFLICVEMFLVSLLFLWSFSATEYKNMGVSQRVPRASIGRAILDVLDIRDILHGFWYMIRIMFCCGMGHALEQPMGKADVEDSGSNVDLRPLQHSRS